VQIARVDVEMVVTQPRTNTELPHLVETSDDGDRPSITEVNGTVAKFEMAFDPRPAERFKFGSPLMERAPAMVFLGFTATLVITMWIAEHASSNSSLFRWAAEHPNAFPCALIATICAFGVVVRDALAGVIITRDSLETRTVYMSVPRVKRYRWAQIDRLVLDDEDVMLELWNGTYEKLPRVRDGKGLATLLEKVAAARGRPVTRLEKKR